MIALSRPEEAFRPLSQLLKVSLALEILTAYAHVRWSLLRGDFRTTFKQIKSREAPVPQHGRAALVNGLRLGRAVSRTLVLLPTDSRCLMRALVLTDLLASRGIESSLVIGVRPHPEFEAHAWVEREGAPLLPDEEFERLVELGGTADVL